MYKLKFLFDYIRTIDDHVISQPSSNMYLLCGFAATEMQPADDSERYVQYSNLVCLARDMYGTLAVYLSRVTGERSIPVDGSMSPETVDMRTPIVT